MHSTKSLQNPWQRRVDLLDLVLLIFAALIVIQMEDNYSKRAIGVDLYQYWGVGQVIRVTDGRIRNPYTHQRDFNRILAMEADRSTDAIQKRVAEFRRDLELQGTPFAYFVFSWFPGDYRLTRVAYRWWQILVFISVLCGLLRANGCSWQHSLLIPMLIFPVYGPMGSEVIVGNFNTTLMIGLAVGLYQAQKLADQPSARDRSSATLLRAVLLLLWIGMFALMKPTMIMIVFVFQLFLIARFGFCLAVKASLLSTVPVGLLAALPMLRFGSASIWLDWVYYFRTSNLDMLNLPMAEGNVSTTLFLSKTLDIPLGFCALFIALLLILPLLLKAQRSGNYREVVCNHLADPHFGLTLGVVSILSLFPLAWIHYFLLLLIPAMILLHPRHRNTAASKLAIFSLIMVSLPYTGIIHRLLAGFKDFDTLFIIHCLVMSSWIPLWVAGLLMRPKEQTGDKTAALTT